MPERRTLPEKPGVRGRIDRFCGGVSRFKATVPKYYVGTPAVGYDTGEVDVVLSSRDKDIDISRFPESTMELLKKINLLAKRNSGEGIGVWRYFETSTLIKEPHLERKFSFFG